MSEINLQSRFKRKYENDNRQWEPDTSIDDILKTFKEHYISYYDGYFYLSDEFYVRHYLYCAACTPIDTLCWDLEDLQKELETCRAGDILSIWTLSEDNPKYFQINCPDQNGLFPKRGAY